MPDPYQQEAERIVSEVERCRLLDVTLHPIHQCHCHTLIATALARVAQQTREQDMRVAKRIEKTARNAARCATTEYSEGTALGEATAAGEILRLLRRQMKIAAIRGEEKSDAA